MRKFMTKEVTVTKVMVGNVGFDSDLKPVVEDVEFIEMLGELDKTKASKLYTKAGGEKTVFNVFSETRTYKMKVSDFIKVAQLVEDDDISLEEDDEENEEEEESK